MQCFKILIGALALVFASAGAWAGGAGTPELTVLNWADYIDPELIAAFEKAHKVKVRVVNFEDDDNRDQLLLATDGVGYDVVVVNETHVSLYRAHGWLGTIAAADVPNLRHVDPAWFDKAADARGYAVPYFWGTLGIAYRRDLVQAPPKTWLDLMKPAPALRGHVAMMSSQREIIGMALKAQGHSVNSTKPEEIDAAMALLLEQKPFVRAYQQALLNEKSELVTGDVAMRMMFNGDALLVKRFNANIEYVVPSEGAALWVDFLTIPAGAPNRKLACAFIDFLNEPANAAKNAAFLNFATPNLAAEKLMPESYRGNPSIYPAAAVLARSELFTVLPPRALSRRNSQFARLLQN